MKRDCTPIPTINTAIQFMKIAVSAAKKGDEELKAVMFNVSNCLIRSAKTHVESIIINHKDSWPRR